MLEMDARTKAIGIITGGRVQALEDAGLMIVEKQEIERLKEKLNAVLQDFYQYVQGGKEICAFCLHDYECEPGETICGATYKGFKWRGLNEREVKDNEAITRLAEYEDTGLSPAEVAKLKFKIERLRAKVIAYEKSGLFPDEVVELAQAKRDGRLVVLPCKVGDTAYYYIDDDELAGPYVGEFTVKGIQILSDGFYLSDGDCWDKIGTQFACLTREEAEKALKDGDAE